MKNYILVLFFVLMEVVHAGAVTFVKPATVALEEPIVKPKDTNPKDVDHTINGPEFKEGISAFITAEFIKAPTDEGQPPLSLEEKAKLMNSLKLELKNADESSKPALLERLKNVSQAISSKHEDNKDASEYFYKDRSVKAQENSNQNTMRMNNQITTQQAEIRQSTLAPVPKTTVGY